MRVVRQDTKKPTTTTPATDHSPVPADLEKSSSWSALLWSGLIALAAFQTEIRVLDPGDLRDGVRLPLQASVLPIFLAIACYWDLRWRRIPNWLNYFTLVLVLSLAAFGLVAGPTLLERLLGALAGFCCILFGHLIGMFGAGDVKAAAVLGAFWGSEWVADGLIYSIIAGGGIAVLSLTMSGQLWRTLCGMLSALLTWAGIAHNSLLEAGSSPVSPRPSGGLPFACALALGAIAVGTKHAAA